MNSMYLNYRPLLEALNNGNNEEAIQRFNDMGVSFDPNVVPYRSGDSLLHIIARLGKTNFLQLLVDKFGGRLNLEVANKEGKRPLHEASQFGRHEVVRILLDKGAEVDPLKRADWTPLMMAVTKVGSQAKNVVKILIEKGNADVTLENKDGWNSFHIAAREGDVDILRLLWKRIPKCSMTKSKNSRTPAHTAALNGKLEALIFLYDECTASLSDRDSCGSTPMMDAARTGHLEIVSYLLETLHLEYESLDKMGRDILSVAAHYGMTNVVAYLITKINMDPNAKSTIDPQMAPIHWCAKEGRLETIKKLVELDANPNLTDGRDRAALHFAVCANHEESVNYLLGFVEGIDSKLLEMASSNQKMYSLLKSKYSLMNNST